MNYLEWLSHETETDWWHDSGDAAEIEQGIAWGAVGVTTNPVLAATAFEAKRDEWRRALAEIPGDTGPQERAIRLTGAVVQRAAGLLRPLHERTEGRRGYVCGQLDPNLAHERGSMVELARRYREWAPNVSVKFPASAAGLDALEEIHASGVSVTSTLSFSVAQVLAAAERIQRARARSTSPAPGFVVIMIGRIDDYLREIARDREAPVSEGDLQLAGLAVVKRAYRLLRERRYDARLMVAALRGPHHMVGACGGELVMSIHPKVQKQLLQREPPRIRGIDDPVPEDVIARLRSLPDFNRIYEPDGMSEGDFLSLGLTQKTTTQFVHAGWAPLERAR